MPRSHNRFLSNSDVKIIAKAKTLVATVTPEDIAALSLPHENIYNVAKSNAKYNNKVGRGGGRGSAEGKSWGVNSHADHRAGGSPPEYTAVELLVDLRRALKRETIDAEEVLGFYMKLSAMLNR